MKRSEMVSLLQKELNILLYSGDPLRLNSCKEEASKLLDVIEKAGMLPPQTGHTIRVKVEGRNVSRLFEWEEE